MTAPGGFADTLRREKLRFMDRNYWIAMAINIVVFGTTPYFLRILFTLMTGFPEWAKYMVVFILSYYAFNIAMNKFLEYLYHHKVQYFEQYRVDNRPWPWEVDAAAWEKREKEVKKTKRINVACGMTIFISIAFIFQFFRTDVETIPSSWELIWQIVLGMTVVDFTNYWIHRSLHHPKLYWIHKIHHEFTQVVGISASYMHPIEYLALGLCSTLTVAIWLGKSMHLGTFGCWMVFRILANADHHIGYEIPWIPFRVLPLSAPSEYHSFHHSHNIGNYCSFFSYWDTICGTNKVYYQHLDKLEEKKGKVQ